MALQLKNKVAKEKNDNTSLNKSGKYKRKRNVFGKRLTRFGLIGTIVGLAICFAVVKVVFTIQQNNKQKKIDDELVAVKAQIKKYKKQIDKKAETYENVGELIATLPTTFDMQATSLDLDRILILSNLSEEGSSRKMGEATMPFECSVSSVKAIKIDMTVIGEVGKIESITTFIDYITKYSHENFYYIQELNYTEDRAINKRSTTTITLYTFYNDIDLTPVTPTDNTNTNTTTQK